MESQAPPPPPPGETPSSNPPPSQEEGPSKNALKKAEKDRKKAELKAQKAAEQEAKQASTRVKETVDTAEGYYGDYTSFTTLSGEAIRFEDLNEEHVKKTIQIPNVILQNVRKQGKTMAFLELRQFGNPLSIQALVTQGEVISEQMVKWTTLQIP